MRGISGIRRNPACGFTLTELMLGMLISLLVMAASLQAYASIRQTIQTNTALADLQERAAFALVLIENDLRLAGFWGLHTDASVFTAEPGIRVHCQGLDVAGWALDLHNSVAVSTGLPCPPYINPVPGSDILEVRHASQQPAELRAGTVQLQTSHSRGRIMADGRSVAEPDFYRVHDLQAHAWFVSPQSSEPGIGALRRYALGHNGLLRNEEIMPGIERLTVSLGVDRDDDGQVDAFVQQADRSAERIIAVRVGLSVRTPTRDGLLARIGNPGGYDGYARTQVERTLVLPNEVMP